MSYHDLAYDTVFIVDDDPVINLLHQKIIGKSGIATEVRSFTDPMQALANLHAELACCGKRVLVLLDINMPAMSGFEFLERMELGDFPMNVDVIVVTSSICEKDRILAERHPFYLRDFLIKPLRVENLTKIIAYL